jgi:hypothetical protein
VDIDPPYVVFRIDGTKPSVLSTVPDYQASEGERIYRSELSVTFTDDMRADDFSDRTFYVTDLLDNNQKVAGYVSYSPALRKAVFVPVVPFKANGFYRVEVKTDTEKADGTVERGVHDLAGNPLDSAMVWTFRTRDVPFEPTWSINLSMSIDGAVTDAGNIAAVEYDAQDGEEEKDVRAVTSLGSQPRLSLVNREGVEFERDIRPADGRLSHHWFLVVSNVASGAEVKLLWQPSVELTGTTRQYQVIRLVEFDATGAVTNRITLDPTQATFDPATGLAEPMVAYTYTAEGETSRYFRLDVQKTELVATTFSVGSTGWVFFSVPITPQVVDPFVNLGDDIQPFKLYKFVPELNSWKVYPLDLGEVSLQAGRGYFTRLTSDVEVDIGGALNQEDVTLTLAAAGWHAIGNPFILPVDIASLKVNGKSFAEAVTEGLVDGTLYRWKLAPQGADADEAVTSGSQLQPWEGYWLKTNQADITLTIPAPAGVAQAQTQLPDSFQPPIP